MACCRRSALLARRRLFAIDCADDDDDDYERWSLQRKFCVDSVLYNREYKIEFYRLVLRAQTDRTVAASHHFERVFLFMCGLSAAAQARVVINLLVCVFVCAKTSANYRRSDDSLRYVT